MFRKKPRRGRKYFHIYLAGPIEAAKDRGVGWREKLAPILKEMGFKVYDPCQLEAKKTGMTVYDSNIALLDCKLKLKNPDSKITRSKFIMIITAIQDNDELLVKKSDIVIGFFPKETSTIGSVDETWICRKNEGVVYLVTDMEMERASSWLLGTCLRSGGDFFTDFESLLEFLKKEYADYIESVKKNKKQ